MKKKANSFFAVLFVIALACSSTYLLAHNHSDTDNVLNAEKSEGSLELIGESKAIEIAKVLSHSEGLDISDYNMLVEENHDDWYVSFEAPAPRAPGDAFTVIVDKLNGDTQIMYDE